jgi:hypothetical protein
VATGDISQKFGSPTTIPFNGTLTFSGLVASTNDVTDPSDAVDVTGLSAVDVIVQFSFKTVSGSVNADSDQIICYILASANGTNYPENVVQSRIELGTGYVTAADSQLHSQPFSVASKFGGTLPPAFKVVMENAGALALSSSTTENAVIYRPVFLNQEG